MIAHVTLRLFDGWPNPEWTLDDSGARKLAVYFNSLPPAARDLPPRKPRLGYRGVTVTFVKEGASSQFHVYDGWVVDQRASVRLVDARRAFEAQIYSSAPPVVLKTVGSMSFAQLITQGNEVPIKGLQPPDTLTTCANGPTLPGAKAWTTFADVNNCYNYANDVLNTDPWSEAAWPGTMTKMPTSTVTATVVNALRTQILKDGVTRVAGDKVPGTCPLTNRHYMAIIVRHHPASTVVADYHCLRLDLDGTWSHKDGSGIPRNTDDVGTGNVITDLTAARFDGDPVLVGIYRAKKNNPKIS